MKKSSPQAAWRQSGRGEGPAVAWVTEEAAAAEACPFEQPLATSTSTAIDANGPIDAFVILTRGGLARGLAPARPGVAARDLT
jgi:hypothetical protein